MDIYTMRLTKDGFEVNFTQPVNINEALKKENYQFRHYRYEYKKKPNDEPVDKSTQNDVQTVPIKQISISLDHKKITVTLDVLKAGYVYELKLKNIKSKEGRPLAHNLICYTLNNLLSEDF